MLLETIVTVLALLIGTWLLVAGMLRQARSDWAALVVVVVAATAWWVLMSIEKTRVESRNKK